MKFESQIARLLLVGAVGAAAMIGCSSDAGYPDEPQRDGEGCYEELDDATGDYVRICDEVTTVPVQESTTTIEEESSTIVDESTPTTSEAVEATSTTVKRTVSKPSAAATSTTSSSAAPISVPTETTGAPETTAAPTTVATTPPTTTAPTTTTLPPVNFSFSWSSDTGCGGLGSLFLDVHVTGATSAGTISVSVNGSAVTAYGGSSFGVGDTEMILFDQWPILQDGTYTVTITASSTGHSSSSKTTSVIYSCPP